MGKECITSNTVSHTVDKPNLVKLWTVCFPTILPLLFEQHHFNLTDQLLTLTEMLLPPYYCWESKQAN